VTLTTEDNHPTEVCVGDPAHHTPCSYAVAAPASSGTPQLLQQIFQFQHSHLASSKLTGSHSPAWINSPACISLHKLTHLLTLPTTGSWKILATDHHYYHHAAYHPSQLTNILLATTLLRSQILVCHNWPQHYTTAIYR